jgi:hypothetical protein
LLLNLSARNGLSVTSAEAAVACNENHPMWVHYWLNGSVEYKKDGFLGEGNMVNPCCPMASESLLLRFLRPIQSN